jgi:formylglycine-generating enzyme required for sulfatase activity
MSDCGAGGEDCCASLEVPGGAYYESCTTTPTVDDAGFTVPSHVSSLHLDKYLVTVGRFRSFAAAWKGGAGWLPPEGAGKHVHLNGGRGLANSGPGGGYETGWVAADDAYVAPTDANLTNCGVYYPEPNATWTSSPGAHESLPINCVTWQEAYAFCIWDGGFLPGAGEWQYAAAGGEEQRQYPWGSTAPGETSEYAIYGEHYTGNPTGLAPVGFASLGAGRWGQLDLVGEVWEWNLDWFPNAPPPTRAPTARSSRPTEATGARNAAATGTSARASCPRAR